MAVVSKDNELFILDESYDIIERLTSTSGAYFHICFSPDETKLLTCSQSNEVTLWDLTTYSVLFTKKYDRKVFSACFNSNGDEIVVTFRHLSLKFLTIEGHDLDKFRHIKVKYIDFNPVEDQFLTSGCNPDNENVILWNSITCEEIFKLQFPSEYYVLCMKFSPDGSKFFVHFIGLYLKIFDTTTGDVLIEFEDIIAASFSPDSSSLVSSSLLTFADNSHQEIKINILTTGETIYRFISETGEIRSIQLRSDMQSILYIVEKMLRGNMYKKSFNVHNINDGTSVVKLFGDEEKYWYSCMVVRKPQYGSYI